METLCNSIQVNNHNNDLPERLGDGAARATAVDEGETNQPKQESLTPVVKEHNHNQRQQQKVVDAAGTNQPPSPLPPPPLPPPPIETANQIKFKRCKHGRIIIKDSSKKKQPPQLGDTKETDTNQSMLTRPIISADKGKLGNQDLSTATTTTTANQQNIAEEVVGINQQPNTAENACDDKTTNEIVDSPVGSDKDIYGPKESEARYLSKKSTSSINNNDNNNNNNNKRRSRSRSPARGISRPRRKEASQSPSPKSPRRHRDRIGSHRHQRSKSPRRRESSRERVSSTWKISQEERKSRSSSNRRHRPSRSPPPPPPSSSHRRGKRSPPSRSKGSRSRYSESLSDDGSRVAVNSSSRLGRDRYPRISDIDISRDSIFGKSSRSIDNINKDLSSSSAGKEINAPKQVPPITDKGPKPTLSHQLSLPTTSTQSKCPPPETAQLQASPEKSPVSEPPLTPSTNDSNSSDIYDPEGPIIAISPGDIPPLSPLIKAANNNNNRTHNHSHNHNQSNNPKNEKGSNNDDDVPSSAVELNKKEKYLQKLNRQERVVEEIKIALKPHYMKRSITKDSYKKILRQLVPKICHGDGEINPVKIRITTEAYVRKMKKRNQ